MNPVIGKWYIQEKRRGAWITVSVLNDTQHNAEQVFFRAHFGLGRLTNADNTIIISVPQGEEKDQ